jgi:hypothetical protein
MIDSERKTVGVDEEIGENRAQLGATLDVTKTQRGRAWYTLTIALSGCRCVYLMREQC